MLYVFRNFFFVFSCALPLSTAAWADAGFCQNLLAVAGPQTASLVKVRDDSSRIFRLTDQNKKIFYFKEIPLRNSEERVIFDKLEMTVIATTAAKSLGLEKYVPHSEFVSEGITINLKGELTKTRPGVLQDGASDVVTPINEFRQTHKSQQPSLQDIQNVLNSGDWPRLYADWKIFWRIFMQVDLNIDNLGRRGKNLYIYDTGDLLNLPNARARMGIIREIDNLHFILPNRPGDRAEHRADFRLADPEFKKMAYTIATESDEETAKRLNRNLNDSFDPPRGSVREHVRTMKQQARIIVELLNKGPFDY